MEPIRYWQGRLRVRHQHQRQLEPQVLVLRHLSLEPQVSLSRPAYQYHHPEHQPSLLHQVQLHRVVTVIL